MGIGSTARAGTGGGAACFELLGVILLARACTHPAAAADLIDHYAARPEATLANSTTLDLPNGSVNISSNLRHDEGNEGPSIFMTNCSLPESVMDAIPGKPLSNILGADWLEHPGLVVEEISKQEDFGKTSCRIRLKRCPMNAGEAQEVVLASRR